MARSSVSSVITADFVNRFRSFASSATPASGSLTSLLQGNSSSSSISGGLRFGAQAFSASLQGLNASISYVNLAREDLQKLRKITTELIDITERATSAATGEGDRQSLNTQFNNLGTQFKQILNNSALRDLDPLTSDGLSEIFKQFGLDEDQSRSIAKIFESFKLTTSDSELASDRIKGNRPVNISVEPPSSYITADTYVLNKVSNSSLNSNYNSFISSTSSNYNDTDTILNQNPTFRSLFLTSVGGTTQSLGAGTITSNIQLIGQDEVNGYALISTTSDLLGYNGSNRSQVYLVDSSGTVLQQVTNNASPTTEYDAGDLSSDGLTILITSSQLVVDHIQLPSLGVDPSDVSITRTTIDTSGGTYNYFNPVVSNDGSHFAFGKSDPLFFTGDSIYFYRDPLEDPDAYLKDQTDIYDLQSFGFADSDTLVLYNTGGRLETFTVGDSSTSSLLSATTIGIDMKVLEENGANSSYVAFFDSGNSNLHLYELASDLSSATEVTSLELGTNSDVRGNSLSLAHNSYGTADVGIMAQLPDLSGDSDFELYRFQYRPLSQLPVSTSEPDTIFEGTISTRSDAYRTLSDLKALKDQIDTNLDVLDQASKIINQNISLVRTTGEALLDLSSQIKDSEDADDVARKLQSEIRRNAGAALNQLENLSPILVATLTQTT